MARDGEEVAIAMRDWSSKVEDLLDSGDREGARKLLEGIVSHLQQQKSEVQDLTLASALADLAALYRQDGLSIKADSLAASAFLLKDRAQAAVRISAPSVSPSQLDPAHFNQEASAAEERPTAEDPCTSGSNGEEDWETLLSDDMVKLKCLPSTGIKTAANCQQENAPTSIKRGRGAFTFGERGMYSDRLSMDSRSDDRLSDEPEDEEEPTPVPYGVRHVLVITFPPHIITKDLEDLFQPFALEGVAIRWVNDTTALAVFRSPDVAREALRCTKNPLYKVRLLAEDDNLCNLVNKRDLEPPVPRPATSSHAAHRMIMGALRKQGIHSGVSSKSSYEKSQKQEAERKQRLLSRQKLRDEAWGPD